MPLHRGKHTVVLVFGQVSRWRKVGRAERRTNVDVGFPAEVGRYVLKHGLHVGQAGEVGFDGANIGVNLLGFGYGGFRGCFVAHVGKQHVCAFAGQAQHDGLADAPATARYNHFFAVQSVRCHALLLVFVNLPQTYALSLYFCK